MQTRVANCTKPYTPKCNALFSKEPHINTETYRQTIQRQISTQIQNRAKLPLLTSFVSSESIAALNQTPLTLPKSRYALPLHRLKGSRRLPASARNQRGMLTAKLNGKQIGRSKDRKLIVESCRLQDAIKSQQNLTHSAMPVYQTHRYCTDAILQNIMPELRRQCPYKETSP